jgi:hypothetical protein
MDPRFDFAADALRLRGVPRQVAYFVTAVFLIGGVLTAGLDLADAGRWDPATLQSWTLVPQTLAMFGLLLLGRWRRSKSFAVLGILIGLIVIEEAFHVLNPVSAWLARIAQIENTWTTVRLGLLNGVLIYGLVAVLGVTLLVVSHWHGSPAERKVVRNLAIMLFVAGFFGGPIATISNFGNTRSWLFVEECGEAVVFAVMVGYVAGLVAHARRSVTSSASSGLQLHRRRGRGPARP